MHTILGINGTSGPALAANLRNRNIPVRGVSRRSFPGDWQHVQADVLEPEQLRSAIKGSEVVYLIVGLQYDLNVWRREWPKLMQTTVDACLENNAKLVFMDNVYSYGLVNGTMTEETPYQPTSQKGEVRVQVNNIIHDAVRNRGLRAAIGRAADFYGPHCITSLLNETVIKRHAEGKKAMWVGDPQKIRSFTYSQDLGPAMAILGTDNRADGQVWHLPTTSEHLTGKQWVELSAGLAGVKAGQLATSTFMLRILGLFDKLMREFVEMNYQNTNDYIFSSEKFERTFGMKPTEPKAGVQKTLEWYKGQ